MPDIRRISLLGGFGVADGAGRALRIRLRKDRALVAWLAMAPGMRRSREAAIGLLWAESDDRRAAASISQSLYSLRRDLGAEQDVLFSGGETIGLDPEAFEVDALEFACLAESRTPDDLRRAEALLAGDFLDGFPAPSDAFEDWMHEERRSFRGLAIDVLSARLDLDEDEGGDGYALSASRLLALDPYGETGVRAMMRHHARRGRMALAAETYDSFRVLLAEDLGVEPDPETEALHAAIMQGELRPPSPPGAGINETAAPEAHPEPASKPLPTRPGTRRRSLVRISALCVGGLAVLVAAFLFLRAPDESDPAAPAAHTPRIAVAPFADLSGGDRSALLAKGLSSDLATALTRLPDVFVSAGNIALTPEPDLAADRDTAEALGVRYLLRGDLQRSGARLRISARLIDTSKGRYVWSTRYESPLEDFFDIQDELVLRIVSDLRGRLDEGERLRRTRDTENLDSWLASTEAYGAFLEFNPAANATARALWTQALNHDPARAVPHAGIAMTHFQDALRGWSPDRKASIAQGLEHARTARERDPEQPLAYQALGALTILQGDIEAGLALRREAVRLAPNDFSAVGGLAAVLGGLGEAEEAVTLFRRALLLNPDPPLWVPIWFGHALHASGRPEEAATWLESALARNPGLAHVHARLAAVYDDLGRASDAEAEIRAALEVSPDLVAADVAKAFSLPGTEFRNRMAARLTEAGVPE